MKMINFASFSFKSKDAFPKTEVLQKPQLVKKAERRRK